MNEQEIVKRMEEIDKQTYDLHTEKWELQQKLEEIRSANLLEKRILSTWDWYYDHNVGDECYLFVRGSSYPTELDGLLEWDHDSKTLRGNIEIGWSDGAVYVSGPINELRVLIIEQDMRVDFSKITEPIVKLTNELQNIKKLAEDFEVDYAQS